MDIVDAVLSGWRACRPDGAVLRAAQLAGVIDIVVARLEDSSVSSAARCKAYEQLAPAAEAGGLPPLVKQLRVDGGYRFAHGDARPVAIVYFVCFWHAVDQVWCTLTPRSSADVEPFAEEAAKFRNILLEQADAGNILPEVFLGTIEDARKSSTDPTAWESLEMAVTRTRALQTCQADKPLPLDEVSTFLLVWLSEITEDYCRGERAAKICDVRNVLGCTLQDACTHLGASGWDIEAAMRRFYIGGPPLVARAACHSAAFSTQSAKLQSAETTCQICIIEFDIGREPVTTRCCYQTLCTACAWTLTDEHSNELRCPFCRKTSVAPMVPEPQGIINLVKPRGMGADLFCGMVNAAGRFTERACSVASDMVIHPRSNSDDVIRSNALRIDVAFAVRV